MVRSRCWRCLAVPFYLAAVVFLALWQDQMSLQQQQRRELLKQMQSHPQPFHDNRLDEFFEVLGNEPNLFLPKRLPNRTTYAGAPKVILAMTDFRQDHMGGCPDYNCLVINDYERLKEADAVITGSTMDIDSENRKQDQYIVFFSQESPVHWEVRTLENFFNLTMGYRRDSDLPCPYGYSIKRSVPLTDEEMVPFSPETLGKKKQSVAWFVSNCQAPSGRQDYVHELQKYISVDIFGSCGDPFGCPKGGECLQKLSQHYRFYLAFENSVCKDYTTEKFWEKAALVPIVPIVLSRKILEPYAPPRSFLAVDDFTSPREMAAHLNFLMHNDTAYSELYEWRRDYRVIFLNGQNHDIMERPWGICRLCQLLWQKPRPTKILRNFNTWWGPEGVCDENLVRKQLAQKQTF